MRLPKDGQEYIRIALTNYPVGATAEASIDRVNWSTIQVNQATGEGLFLCRGPQSTQTGGTLVAAGTDVWVRVDGSPEQVIRKVGILTLY